MKITENVSEWKENHPKARRIIIGATVTSAAVVCTYLVCSVNGIEIKVTTPKIRDSEFNLCGDARELCNAVKGIEAKGLDPTATLERFNELRDSYVH